MAFTEQLTQALSIPVASLYPANATANNANVVVGPFTMKEYRRAMAHIVVGVVGTNCNLACYWQASNANNGTFTNLATQVFFNTTTSNSEGTIEVRADQLGNNNSWLQLIVLPSSNNGAGGIFVAASVYGGESSYKPANQFDFAGIIGNATNTRNVT